MPGKGTLAYVGSLLIQLDGICRVRNIIWSPGLVAPWRLTTVQVKTSIMYACKAAVSSPLSPPSS